MTTFVQMWHPSLPGTPHVQAPLEAENLYAAHGWLVVDGTTPVPAAEFLTMLAGDGRYLQRWQPSLAVTAGQVFVDPTGQPIQRTANGTTRASYDATEQAAWSLPLKAAYGTVTLVNATGTADSAAILAAFNGMKDGNGHASGTLVIKGNAALDTALVLDGGYSDLEADADFTSGDGRHFAIVCQDGSLIPSTTAAKALTLRGFHEPVIDVRFQGGGNGRSVTDAAMTSGQATLTSATAAFTSADVGRTVTVDGAGVSGGPLLTEITAVTDAATATVCTNAAITVSGARATITTNALQLENLVGMTLTLHGVNYAGTLCHAETRGIQANRIRLGHVKRIYATYCGRGIAFAGLEAFGSMDQLWIDDCTWGDVWSNVNDTNVVHYEGGAFNTTNYPFVAAVNCGGNHWGTMTFGDRPASEGMIAIYGGSFGTINTVRCTAYMPGSAPTYNGLVVVDTKSLVVKSLQTARCNYSLWSRGGDIVIGKHFSEGSDGRVVQIEPGVTRTAPTVITDIRSSNNYNEVAYVTAGVTGGLLKIRGVADTYNFGGAGGVYAINCQSTAMLLDVTDFADYITTARTTTAGSLFCATQGNVFGVARARLGKPPANHGAAPAAIAGFALNALQTNTSGKTLNVGLQLHCDPSSGTAAYVTVLVGPNGGLSQVSREIRQLPAGVTQAASTASDYGISFRVPPGWVWQINTTAVVSLVSAVGWYE